MPITITKTFYSFSELTEEQQKAYIAKNPEEFEPFDDWYESTLDDIKDALTIVGFSYVEVYFSGFCSQGDGAQFNGDYNYRKGALAKVKKEFPQWEALHHLAESLQKLEKQYFYSIYFSIKHSGHYSHENCTVFDFGDKRHNYGWVPDNFNEDDFKDCCRSFMQDIYSTLEKEYYYLQSLEYILECPESWDHIQIEQSELNNL